MWSGVKVFTVPPSLGRGTLPLALVMFPECLVSCLPPPGSLFLVKCDWVGERCLLWSRKACYLGSCVPVPCDHWWLVGKQNMSFFPQEIWDEGRGPRIKFRRWREMKSDRVLLWLCRKKQDTVPLLIAWFLLLHPLLFPSWKRLGTHGLLVPVQRCGWDISTWSPALTLACWVGGWTLDPDGSGSNPIFYFPVVALQPLHLTLSGP